MAETTASYEEGPSPTPQRLSQRLLVLVSPSSCPARALTAARKPLPVFAWFPAAGQWTINGRNFRLSSNNKRTSSS